MECSKWAVFSDPVTYKLIMEKIENLIKTKITLEWMTINITIS